MGFGGSSTSNVRCKKCRADTKYGKMLRANNRQCRFCLEYYNR